MRPGAPQWLSTRRRRMLLALLVLPVLVLRALVPIGFMPVSDRGSFHIDFCPGEAQPPGALAAQPLAHHHHHGGADHGAPAPVSHAPCLFALSASPAFAPAVAALALVPPAATALATDPSSRVFLPAIVRAQTPRGPPFPA
ncbi:MAG TPA: hypothetical protein VEU78_10925 [Steroidobacteraceae bacterium]|nr:hypothetical protein [Steroidobacteraceae bacterium]